MIYLFDRQKKLQKILPRKNILSAVQTVELNGLYTVSVEVPLFYETKTGTQYNHKKSVENAWFVGHYDRKKRFQLYKIHSRKVRADNKRLLLFDGVHIFFDEAKAMGNIHDRRFRDTDVKAPADVAFNSIGWYIKDYDVTDRADITFYRDSVANARSLIIEKFGVEFDYGLTFDGRKIISKDLYIKKRLGKWTGKRFAYGTNLLSLTQEQDESEVYTAAVGRGKGETIGEGNGPRVEFTDIEWSKDGITKPVGQNWIELPAATQAYGFYEDGEIKPRFAPEVIFENTENKLLIADSTYYWLLENSAPKAVWETNIAKSDVHDLGDGVGVIYKKADIIKSARVHKMENNLLDDGLSKVILGDYGYFKTDRKQQKITAQIKRNHADNQSYITQMENAFDARMDSQTTAIDNAYQQAVIDANANIQAAEVRMQTEIDTQRQQMTENINTARDTAIEQAEADAKAKADAVQSNLESFERTHQQLYDSVTSDIMDIDTFLGDKSRTLAQQFADVESDFSGLQSELSDVSGDLSAARSELHQQLDEARAKFEALKVGGRNLIPNSVAPINKDGHQTMGSELHENVETPLGVYDIRSYTNINSQLLRKRLEFKEETDYIFSVYVRTVNEGDKTRIGMDISDVHMPRFDVTNEWKRIHVKASWEQLQKTHYRFLDIDIPEKNIPIYVAFWQLETGNMLTPWTPAPEDTEAKITTLNQEIEFIEGELSAKLERTDIEPINNKITEYGNTLTANAQSIKSLLDKTELHDGDITQWSNETKANAESISQTLTRVEETEAGIKQAKTDIQTNADGIAGVIRDVETIDGNLSTLTTDFNVEAGKIETLISKTDGHDTQLTNIVADYNSIEQTVAANDEWLGTHGSNILQTVEGFERKVWQSDIQNPNLLRHTDVTKLENRIVWENVWANSTGQSYVDWAHVRSTDSYSRIATRSTEFEMVAGKQYSISFEAWENGDDSANTQGDMGYTFITASDIQNISFNGSSKSRELIGTINGANIYRYFATFTATESTKHAQFMIGTITNGTGLDAGFRFRYPKVEMSEFSTPYVSSFSTLEHRADIIDLQVQEIKGNAVYQSDITINPDSVDIGSVKIDGDTIGAVLSVSPSGIDAVAEQMRLTGDLYVDGDIESISLSAIEANIARVRTAFLTSGVIKADHIEAGTQLVEHIFANNGRIDHLISKTHFVDNIKAMTIEAVYGDIRSLTSEIFTSNIIKSNWLNVDTALFDRLTADEAFIDRLVVKAANIRNIQAVTIDAIEANLETVMDSMGNVAGGLNIMRPDGALFVENGLEKFGHPVPLTDYYDPEAVEFNGRMFTTAKKGAQIFKIAYGDHAGRYYNLSVGVDMRWDSGASATWIGVNIRPQNLPAGVSIPTHTETFVVDKDGGSDWHTLSVPIGTPTYDAISFTIEFYRVDDAVGLNYVQIRTGRSWISA